MTVHPFQSVPVHHENPGFIHRFKRRRLAVSESVSPERSRHPLKCRRFRGFKTDSPRAHVLGISVNTQLSVLRCVFRMFLYFWSYRGWPTRVPQEIPHFSYKMSSMVRHLITSQFYLSITGRQVILEQQKMFKIPIFTFLYNGCKGINK